MMELLGNILGGVGVACFLLAYFMLQQEKWKHNSPVYLGANLCGALLVMISLVIDWNLPAFVLEAIWAMISMWGLIKVYRLRRTP